MADAEPSLVVGSAKPRARRVWAIAALVSAVALGAALVATFSRSDQKAESLAPRETRPTPVRTAPVTRDTILLTAAYRGELDADVADLSAQTTGRLEQVHVRLGDEVKKGDLLALIDASQTRSQISAALAQVRAANAAKQRAAAELAAARAEFERGERLLAEQLVTQQAVDTMKARIDIADADSETADAMRAEAEARVGLLREQLKETKLVAPFDGAVAARYLDAGALVQPGAPVLRLVRSGLLRVRFSVPERELGGIARDMPFELSTQATGQERFVGTISRIAAEVSRVDRSATVEGVLDAARDVLRPGMYAEVRVTFGKLDGALVVPSAAIVEKMTIDGKTQIGVYAVAGEKALWKEVRVLGQSGDRSALEGVPFGTPVITLGHDYLRDGTAVRVTPEESP